MNTSLAVTSRSRLVASGVHALFSNPGVALTWLYLIECKNNRAFSVHLLG
jgi:hypothetical protein